MNLPPCCTFPNSRPFPMQAQPSSALQGTSALKGGLKPAPSKALARHPRRSLLRSSPKSNHHVNDTKAPPPPLREKNKKVLHQKHDTGAVPVESMCACRRGQPLHHCAAMLAVLPLGGRIVPLAPFTSQHLEAHAEFVGGFIVLWWAQSASELILEIEGPL